MAHVAATAAAAGVAAHRPPALSISFSSTGHSRHGSFSSSASSQSDDEPSALSALDSSAALILVHDQDEHDDSFDFTDEEDDLNDNDDIISPLFDVRKSVVFPPLPPTLVFLYLLAPYLKLGALELPNSELPLKYGLPALLFSALASAFARQIWYMLARYLRKADMTDILIETFAKGRGKERQRAVIRFAVRSGTGAISSMLAIIYLRHAMYTLQPLLATSRHPTLTYILSTLAVTVLVGYMSCGRSLSSRRVVYATWLSAALYIAWLGCTIYAHVHGLLEAQTGWLGAGYTWQGIGTTVFAFCSSSTLPLYISLQGTALTPISTAKTPISRSFRMISVLSVLSAVLLLLPSAIFAAFPNHPELSHLSVQQDIPPHPNNSTNTPILLTFMPTEQLNATLIPALTPLSSYPAQPEIALPSIQVNTVRGILAAATLLLGAPTLILVTPPIAIPSLRSVKFNVSRLLITILVLALSLIPPHALPSADEDHPSFLSSGGAIFTALTIALVLMVLAATYSVPALLHILTHTFKRPLAIVVPPRTPLLQTPTADADGGARLSPRLGADELLLRKERALQQRQLRKRIGWDVGVWLLLGASAVGVIAIGAGLFGVW